MKREKQKLKIIQFACTSHSFFSEQLNKTLYWALTHDWYAYVSFEMKKRFPELEIECWTPERRYKKEKIFYEEGIKFRVFPGSIFVRHGMELSFPLIKALKEEIKNAKNENKKLILHFHEYHSWQTYLTLLSINKTKGIKIISQHHGGRSPLKNLKKYKRFAMIFPIIMLMQFFENLALKKVDIFYSLSDEEIEYAKKISPHSGVKFQTMGISDDFFRKASKNDARKKLNLDKDKKYILYVGRVKATKGIKELLDAMKSLSLNEELLIIGGGVDLEMFKKYAIKNKIKNVRFLGTIYNNSMLFYLDACDCLILPSYTEGAPVVLMEAIAKNLPVIATDVGGVKKMIENNREGIIIKPKSSKEIVKALREILKWKKRDIKKYAEKYRWKKIIDETFKDYIK